MQRLLRRLAALLVALALLSAGLVCAEEGDWRDKLRALYGLSDDGGAQSEADEPKAEPTDDGFEWPVTAPQQIVNYLERYGELPENFITKAEARALGWDSRVNYVGDVAPGMSIGGDRYGNYEGLLPMKKGRKWFECDANYGGKKRGPERVVYSTDGLYYYTSDHYQTFTQMFPED